MLAFLLCRSFFLLRGWGFLVLGSNKAHTLIEEAAKANTNTPVADTVISTALVVEYFLMTSSSPGSSSEAEDWKDGSLNLGIIAVGSVLGLRLINLVR